MDRATILFLLSYNYRLLKEQLLNKRKYRKLELSYSKDSSLKRKQFLAQAVQASMKQAMKDTQSQIIELKQQLKSLP
jgi:hypothetical protein